MAKRARKKTAGGLTKEQLRWRERIERSRNYRERLKHRWRRVQDEIDGSHDFDAEGNTNVNVNLAHSTLQTALPTTMLRTPKFRGKALRQDAVESAKLAGHVADYWHRELKTTAEMRRSVADAKAYNLGVAYLGFLPEGADYPEADKGTGPTIEEQLEREIEATEAEIDKLLGIQNEKAFATEDPQSLLDPTKKRNSFFIEHIPHDQFLWDEEATRWEHCRWMAREYYWPVKAIQNDVRFDPAKRKNVFATRVHAAESDEPKKATPHGGPAPKNAVAMTETMPSVSSKTKDEIGDGGFDRIVEIWDQENQRFKVWAESIQDFLQDIDNPYKGILEGMPFVVLQYTLTPGNLTGLSDMAAALPQMEELRHIRTQQAIHVRKSSRKYRASTNVYSDKEQMDNLMNNDDGTIIHADDKDVGPIPDAPFSFDFDRLERSIKSDYNTIVAQGELQRGAEGSADSATEASILQQNSMKRESYELELTEEFYAEVTRKLFQLLKAFMPGTIARKIAGEGAETTWQQIQRSDIQGEYLIEIIPGTSVRTTDAIHQQRLIQFLQVVQPYAIAGQFNAGPLIRAIGESMEIPNIDEMMQITPQQPDAASPLGMPFQAPGTAGLADATPNAGGNAGAGLSAIFGGGGIGA